MSKPTQEQTDEFFRLWADGKITEEILQEVIERTAILGLKQALQEVLHQACNVAYSINPPRSRDEALRAIARAMAEAGDLEAARKVANTISDPYGRVEALVAIAGAMMKAIN